MLLETRIYTTLSKLSKNIKYFSICLSRNIYYNLFIETTKKFQQHVAEEHFELK